MNLNNILDGKSKLRFFQTPGDDSDGTSNEEQLMKR